MLDDEQKKVQWQKNAIREQLHEQQTAQARQRREDRDNELAQLRNVEEQHAAEDLQRLRKDSLTRQNLKKAWLEQMQLKEIHDRTDKLFK